MAAITSANISIVQRLTLGNRVLVVAKVKGVGTTFNASQVGLVRIDSCWTQSIDDAVTEPIKISDYSGTSITFAELTAGDYSLFFMIGY